MNSLTMEMTKLGLQPTKRMYSLSMEAALQANNLEVNCSRTVAPVLVIGQDSLTRGSHAAM